MYLFEANMFCCLYVDSDVVNVTHSNSFLIEYLASATRRIFQNPVLFIRIDFDCGGIISYHFVLLDIFLFQFTSSSHESHQKAKSWAINVLENCTRSLRDTFETL